MRWPDPDPPLPGQESVWDYPRPAVLRPNTRHILICHRGHRVADTRGGFQVLETSHPPSYYLPPDAFAPGLLTPNPRRSLCEWKGQARYWDVVVGSERMEGVGWSYPSPTPAFAAMKDHIALYPSPFDEVLVDGEQVTPQPGGFYGGWITRHVAGPFKGPPGTQFW
ncbi:DUF427 domain-containing protein [Sphingomonas sp. CJ99]